MSSRTLGLCMVTLTVEDKCQSAETPRSSNLHVPLISQALHTKKGGKGRTHQSGGKSASSRVHVDENEVRHNSPNVMVCSCDSGAHARDECTRPSCQYWHYEGQEAGQEEQDMLCVVRCGTRGADMHSGCMGAGLAHRRAMVWGRMSHMSQGG